MESTNGTKTKHPRLEAKTSSWYSLHECDQTMITHAIEKAQRGETSWSQKPKTVDSTLGERTITDAALHYRMSGADKTLEDEREITTPPEHDVPKTDDGRPQRAERVWVEATIEGSGGGSEKVEIETDAALLNPNGHWPTEFGIALAADTGISVDELVELLVQACFEPGNDPEDDNAETQRDDFDAHALQVATTMLLPRRLALERQLENAVRRYGANLVKEGEIATITVANQHGGNGKREVQATVHGT